MYTFEDLNTITPGGIPLLDIVTGYIREKNLSFIVAQGRCSNRRAADLAPQELTSWMAAFAACTFSKVSCPDLRPCPPFMAADLDEAAKTATLVFLIDLTQEAQGGMASKFYSKILGALSSQFFAANPGISRLFFPFGLADTATGKGLSLEKAESGTWIILKDRGEFI